VREIQSRDEGCESATVRERKRERKREREKSVGFPVPGCLAEGILTLDTKTCSPKNFRLDLYK
jgi:hypothetical protein